MVNRSNTQYLKSHLADLQPTGNSTGIGGQGSRSKDTWVKVSLKVMILAGGLTSTSSCIFFFYISPSWTVTYRSSSCWVRAVPEKKAGGGEFFQPINKLALPLRKIIGNYGVSTRGMITPLTKNCILDTTPTPPPIVFFLGHSPDNQIISHLPRKWKIREDFWQNTGHQLYT